MLKRNWKLIAIAVAGTFVLSLSGQPQQPNWKDRAEYDLYEALTKETAPAKKLELLNSWKEKYPTSEMKKNRQGLFLQTYQQLNNGAKMMETAREIVGEDPKNVTALYWINLLTISLRNEAADALDAGEKAANGLLGELDATFAADKKPAATSEADWKNQKNSLQALGHRTLGWVAWKRKNFDAAEEQFLKVLTLNPNDGEASYMMGTVILGQKKPEKQAAALYHIARASTVPQTQGGMADAARKQAQAFVEKSYITYHGDREGLDEILTVVRTNPMPPPEFKIKSKAERDSEAEQEFIKKNPTLALWLNVKKALQADGGDQYFVSAVKETALPALKGKLISHSPAVRPKELQLAIDGGATPDVTLKLSAPLAGKADPGTEIGFEEGSPSAFTKEPFMLTIEVEKEKITGWPAQAAPAPKKAPATKKGATKKK